MSRPGFGDVIVELKGTDVDHAVRQVEATAAHWSSNGYKVGRLGAIIVAKQYPKISTNVRKAQERFASTYRSPLHVVTKNYEGTLEMVLSFSGPYSV